MKKTDELEVYQIQILFGRYLGLTSQLFDLITLEGWLGSIEMDREQECTIDDFEFLTLNLSPDDRAGLQRFHQHTVDKFNELDIRIKNQQKYPYYTLDFIDYEMGIVYIIRFKDRFEIDFEVLKN